MPPSIAWHNLHSTATQFTAWKFQKPKTILTGLTGSFTSGTLNCLLGPSGAGKTTLLNALSGTSSTSCTSQIYLSCEQPRFSSYYIKQHIHESIVGELTVGQILRYAFAFKNEGQGSTKAEKHISSVMKSLLLPEDLQRRRFGKCSGGEQKRIAIAQEMMSLTQPTFLFIDEPTTGLDSASAYEVMFSLQKLATEQGITVITSIHAPSDEILRLFDQIYVLARGGVAIYSGPPEDIRDQLEGQLGTTIPDEQPPIEALLKIACNGTSHPAVLKLATQTSALEVAKFTTYQPTLSAHNPSILTPQKTFNCSNLTTHLARQCRTTFLAQWRLFLFLPLLFLLYFGTVSSIYDLSMTTYTGCYPNANTPNRSCDHKTRLKADDYVKANSHYLVYVSVLAGFMSLITSTLFYSTQLKALQAEARNHWYSIGVFYTSTNVVSFIELNCTVACLTVCSYFLSNQHAADGFRVNWNRFGSYGYFLWLQCLYGQAFGHFLGILLVNSPAIALIACQLVNSTICLLNGLYIKFDRLDNAFLERACEILGMVFLTRGLFYSIYGIDRCDLESEYSWVLVDHHVEVNRIAEYGWRVGVNILVVKLLTAVILYVRFSSITFWKRKQISKNVEAECNGIVNEIVENDEFDCAYVEMERSNSKQNLLKNPESSSHVAIAWRRLTLFGSTPLFTLNDDSARTLPEHRQMILRGLNGHFRFGSLNSLMGTSGAGKTSFLKVLNGQCKSRLSDDSAIYLSTMVKIRTCFITQEVSGHLISGLTAHQAVVYASRLKNSGQVGLDHDAIALRWLQELDLAGTVNTRVEHCSGGERKRLAVAQELTSVEMPNLICIDEPTSGLDTNSAEIVISTLRRLIQSHPVVIVTSIHQPTAEILHLFDQLYVLARGGVCIYSGPPGAIQTFLDQAKKSTTSIGHFPIEALMKYSCSSHQNQTVQRLTQMTTNSQLQNDHLLLQNVTLMPDGILPNRTRFSVPSLLAITLRLLATIRGHLWIEWLFYFNASLGYAFFIRYIFPVKIVTASGCVNLEDDFNVCTKTAKEMEEEFLVTDNLAYNYFYSVIYMLLVLLNSSFSFFKDFAVFSNEHRNGWYSTSSWYLVKSIAEILPLLPTICIYIYILDIYEEILPDGSFYWQVVLLMTLATLGFCSMGHCFNLLSSGNLNLTMLLLVTSFMLGLILDNTAIHIEGMAYYWQALSTFSISRYLFSSILLLQYGFGRCQTKTEVQVILHAMGIVDADYEHNVMMLVVNLVIFRMLAFWLLLRKANPPEGRRRRQKLIEKYLQK